MGVGVESAGLLLDRRVGSERERKLGNMVQVGGGVRRRAGEKEFADVFDCSRVGG